MELQDFHKDLLEEVKATAMTEGGGSNAAFVNIITNYLINAEVLTDFNMAFYSGVGRSNRKLRVDGYVYDEFDNTINLIISDYTGEEKREPVTKSSATPFFERLLYFVQEAYETRLYKEVEISTPAADLIDFLRLNREKFRKYRLILITDALSGSRLTDYEEKTFLGLPVICQIWGIDRVYRICCSDMGRQNIEIDFKSYTGGNGIPCIAASSANNDDYKSYLCIIPGSTLADIYDNYGSLLLEGNVRSFLSTKVAVNKKIRETILKIPQNFFAYNNGVSATAMDIKVEAGEEGKFITYARDFQIINGGQTTASLSNARFRDKADLNNIFVQMKLTVIDGDADKSSELIRNISRSSNSQNKVSDADFFSTHPFHIRMEQISRRLFAPATGGAQYETKWFYERAKGQWLQMQMRMSKAAKDKFATQNPKKQLITKTDLAKVRNTWAGMPQVVSKGAQTNFIKYADIIDEAWSRSDTKFNDRYFKDSVALTILFKSTEWVVSHQPWFEQGYRANIVTYSLALFHKLILDQFAGYDLDLQLIWNRQSVPDLIINELVTITKYVFETITDPARETINVTQWCKRDNCWKKVLNCDIQLNRELKKVLISKEELRNSTKDALKDQRISSTVDTLKKIIDIGVDNWNRIFIFAQEKRLGSPDMLNAVKIAMRLPEKIPTDRQAKLLIELFNLVESEGFKL